MLLLENIMAVWKGITLEPTMIMYYTALALTALNGQNLILQKACHPGDTLPSLTSACENEVESQKLATNIQTWKQLIMLFGPVIFVLFAGPWSDNHGKRRKPLMYLPLCGQVLSDLLCMLNVYFWNWSPAVAALSESILPAITGFRSCFFVGAHSYIADITCVKTRTVRLGMCAAVFFLGTPIGAFTFGLFFHRIGFYGIYLLCTVLNLAAIMYLFLFVNDNKCDESALNTWEGLFDTKCIVQSLKTTFKVREGYRRAVVLLILILAPISLAPLQGEYAILYFYLRYQFHWNEVDYGFYAGYKTIIIFVGTLITMGIFSRLLRISDAVIGMMSCVTLMIASVGYTFASMTWQLYVFPIVDFMHGAGLAVVFSIVSKTIESNELGQVNSIIGVADAVFPLINLPLYTQVYNHTFTQLPGAFFILSFIYGVTALIIFGVVYVLQRMPVSEEVPNEKTKL